MNGGCPQKSSDSDVCRALIASDVGLLSVTDSECCSAASTNRVWPGVDSALSFCHDLLEVNEIQRLFSDVLFPITIIMK